jgi:S1-C subfamily serine protease
VLVEEIPFDELDAMQLSYGVEVQRVIPDSPASDAGLREGDILLEVGGEPVFSVSRLRWLVGQPAAGTTLEVKYSRDGTAATVNITPRLLRAGPTPPAGPLPPPDCPHGSWGRPGYLGVTLQALTPGLREAFGAPENTGALVAEVNTESPASRAGLQAGDVIVKMDRRTIRDIGDVMRVLDYFGPGEAVQVEIIRDKASQTLNVDLGEGRESRSGDGGYHSWHHPEPGAMPFFTDPDWWRNIQQYMERWQQYWNESHDESSPREL